ncbi:MAG: DedA family protein [Geodermatophilaceae bacterium]|nr:DedA family protein [Geodermatophilaceae bacterium]
MTTTLALGPEWLKPDVIIGWLGPWALIGLALIVFAECGLLLGFFLPGDTLLFSVGIFVSQGVIDHSIWLVCLVLTAGAVLGNLVGYEIGRRVGPLLLDREDRRLLRPEHVERTRLFFERYGAPAIVLARFVPIVRTVITVTAGAAEMGRRRYFLYSTVGGVVWVFGVTLPGYFLGNIAFVRDHIQPRLELVLLGVVVLSILPMVIHLARERMSSRRRERVPNRIAVEDATRDD